MPRTVCARGVLRLRASASIAPQYAPACPMTVVTGDRLGDQDRAAAIERLEQTLHTAVLVPQHDLEEEHGLSVRLEAEVPRLDDPGVHRADPHFVDLVAFHLRERIRLAVQRARAPSPAARDQAGAGATA